MATSVQPTDRMMNPLSKSSPENRSLGDLLVSPVVRVGATAPARLDQDPDAVPTLRTEWRSSTTPILLVESLVPSLLPASTLAPLPSSTLAYAVTSRDAGRLVDGQTSTPEGHPDQALTTTAQATLGLEQPLVSPLVAAYLIFVVVVSVVANMLVVVVRVCGRRRRVRSSHVCTLSLAVSDVAFSLLVHTLMILAALGVDSALLFNTIGCNYYGFCAMFFGTFSMCIHASVSLIRYINICHPEKVEWLQLKYVYILILGSGLYSVAWAVGPILQWGRYETFEFGCTLAFTDPSRSNRSYVTCAFFFVLLFPLGVVVTCYSLIVMQAHKYQREMSRIAHGGPNKTGDMATIINHVGSVRKTQRSLRLHNKLIRMSMVVAGGYVLGWLPYAAVCMWATYGDYQHIPIEIRVGASLICKSATAYNPFIYYFMSEGFRADLRWLGRRAGFSTKTTATGSTYQPSFRSSTRSSVKKSRDRTRENSLNLMTASGKDSTSTCITNGNAETPPTPLSLLNSTEAAEEYSMYVMPNPILISSGLQANYNGLPLSNSDLKHMDRCSTSLQGSRKLISESSLSSDGRIGLNYGSRAKLTKCENIPLRYPCRRSVSFSVSPTGSPTITRSPSEKVSGQEHPWRTSRSRSLYGFRENRKLRKQRDLITSERRGHTDV